MLTAKMAELKGTTVGTEKGLLWVTVLEGLEMHRDSVHSSVPCCLCGMLGEIGGSSCP